MATLNQNVTLILLVLMQALDQGQLQMEFLHVPVASTGLQAALGSQLLCGQRIIIFTPLLDKRDPILP